MKLALVLAVLLGCGSSPATKASSTTATPTAGGNAEGQPTTTPAVATKPTGPKPQYSCFAYASKNSAMKRHACARSDDCGGYLDQAKNVPGLKDFTTCEVVASVFCFHQAATADDPDGEDICQPTLDECKAGR